MNSEDNVNVRINCDLGWCGFWIMWGLIAIGDGLTASNKILDKISELM